MKGALIPLTFLHSNGKLDPADAQSSTKPLIFTCATQQAGCEMRNWQLPLRRWRHHAKRGASHRSNLDAVCAMEQRHQTVVTSLIPPSLSSHYDNANGFSAIKRQQTPSAAHSANASPSAPAHEHLGTKTIEGVRVSGGHLTSTQPSGIGAPRLNPLWASDDENLTPSQQSGCRTGAWLELREHGLEGGFCDSTVNCSCSYWGIKGTCRSDQIFARG